MPAEKCARTRLSVAGVRRVFWEQGIRGTTTRELEARLGLSQSSIYNAFGSKHELVWSVLSRYEARISSELVEPLEQAQDGLDALDRFFARFGEWIGGEGARGCMIVNLMAEDGDGSPEVTARTRAYRQRVRDAFRDALLRAAEAGEGSAGDCDFRAYLLMGVVLGTNVAARGGAADDEVARLVIGARRQIAAWRD